jgi:hypothetical protein
LFGDQLRLRDEWNPGPGRRIPQAVAEDELPTICASLGAVIAVHDEHWHRDLLEILGELGLGEGDDPVVVGLRAAHHARLNHGDMKTHQSVQWQRMAGWLRTCARRIA